MTDLPPTFPYGTTHRLCHGSNEQVLCNGSKLGTLISQADRLTSDTIVAHQRVGKVEVGADGPETKADRLA